MRKKINERWNAIETEARGYNVAHNLFAAVFVPGFTKLVQIQMALDEAMWKEAVVIKEQSYEIH